MALRDIAKAILESYSRPESAVERLKFDKLMKELSAELVSDEPDKSSNQRETQNGT